MRAPDGTTEDSGLTSADCFSVLSRCLLAPSDDSHLDAPTRDIRQFCSNDLQRLWELAGSHHVILRALPSLKNVLASDEPKINAWIEKTIAAEQARIQNALSVLAPICQALETIGSTVVIKSLDHWPDLGNDLDLYSAAPADRVVAAMREDFQAQLAERSWGDRLANKWNFVVPGMPELVEIHIGRLGQTGEQVAVTKSLVARARHKDFGVHSFPVPAAEDRVIISTLQRMYRHFYLRLCDVANISRLVESDALDYDCLESLARSAGLWEGLATYLVIVSEYVELYRGKGPALPASVTKSAEFGNAKIRFREEFLRVPIFPEAAGFYAKEWQRICFSGDLSNTLRLSLLPGLAVAAVLALKITGSDKGVW